MEVYVELQEQLKLLNDPDPEVRLANLEKLIAEEKEHPAVSPQYANNHIHTIYSFSPYSPTAAVYVARAEGLETAGIMDHDSIGGAREFRKAGKIAGIGTTCGMECRVSFADTKLAGRKTNNPDQAGVSYMTIHSVPATGFDRLNEVFAPLRAVRNERTKKMLASINELLKPYDIFVDFEKDVIPVSTYEVGGAITERHMLYALCLKIVEKAGKENTASFVEDKMGIPLTDKQKVQLTDPSNPHFLYDLLGIFKAQYIGKVFIPASKEECLPLAEVVKLAEEVGGILCYPYLGDVKNSVTGDKKAAKYEDDFLDELFEVLHEEGVKAITYMPARNTLEQVERLQGLCRKYNMTEISGEDVNSSRQSMICKQLELPQFTHLVDMAWKLVEREKDYPLD